MRKQDPMNRTIEGIPLASIYKTVTLWMDAATKYPNGVFQLNGNLYDGSDLGKDHRNGCWFISIQK